MTKSCFNVGFCVVLTCLGSVTVTYGFPPLNDGFHSATYISPSGGLFTGKNTEATKETGEPNHAGKTGGASVWWRWTAPADGTATINTFGSDFDTLLAVYIGSYVNSLTPIAYNDDACNTVQSQVSFNAFQGTTYKIAVDGLNGAQGNIRLRLVPDQPANDNFAAATSVPAQGGHLTGHNLGATKENGEPAHSSLTGGASVWWKWTAPATARATINTFGSDFDTVLAVYYGSSVSNLHSIVFNNDAGTGKQSQVSFLAGAGTTYRIAVDGLYGITGEIKLQMAAAPPANDNFDDAIVITGGSGEFTGTNRGATYEVGEPQHAGKQGYGSVWWSWQALATGTATIDTFDSDFDTLLAVYTGYQLDGLTQVAANDDANSSPQSQVQINVVEGEWYHIAVDGKGDSNGNIKLKIVPPVPANDNFLHARVLSAYGTSELGTNFGATKEAGEPAHANKYGTASVWWSWTTPVSRTVTIDTFKSDFDTVLAVYSGNSVDSLTEIISNDNDTQGSSLGRQSRVQFRAIPFVNYRIAVDGAFEMEKGRILLNLTLAPGNDDFANAFTIPGGGGIVDGSNLAASRESGEPAHAGNSVGPTVWWKWTAQTSGLATINTYGSDFDTALAVYVGDSVDSLSEVVSQAAFNNYTVRVQFNTVAGTTYRIAVLGNGYSTGIIHLIVTPQPPPNDNFADAIVIPPAGGQGSGTNYGATWETGEPLSHGVRCDSSVWWKWTAPASGPTIIATTGSEFDTLLAVYTGSTPGALTEVASNDDWYSLQSQVQFQAVAGTTYRIAVDGYGGASGDIALKLYMGEPELLIKSIYRTNGECLITVDASAYMYFDLTIEQRTNLIHGADWAPAPDQQLLNQDSGKYLITVPESDSPTIFYRALILNYRASARGPQGRGLPPSSHHPPGRRSPVLFFVSLSGLCHITRIGWGNGDFAPRPSTPPDIRFSVSGG